MGIKKIAAKVAGLASNAPPNAVVHPRDATIESPSTQPDPSFAEVLWLAADQIWINRNVYRIDSDDEERKTATLAESMRRHGQLLPVVVRRVERPGGARFELVAGYRRLKAAQSLGLLTIKAVLYDGIDPQTCFFAENEHRFDLLPVERARLVRHIHRQYGGTHEATAEILCWERKLVTEELAIAALPNEILEEAIDLGPAISRAVLLEVAQSNEVDRAWLWRAVVNSGCSRETLRTLKRRRAPKRTRKRSLAEFLRSATVTARSWRDRLHGYKSHALSPQEQERCQDLLLVLGEVERGIEGLVPTGERKGSEPSRSPMSAPTTRLGQAMSAGGREEGGGLSAALRGKRSARERAYAASRWARARRQFNAGAKHAR